MSKKEEILSGKKIFNSIVTIFTGNALSKAIAIILTPIIARIYSPNEVGMFALYLAIVTILYPVMGMKFSQAIPLPKKKEVALLLSIASLLASVINIIVIIVIYKIIGIELLRLINAEWLQKYLVLLCLSIILLSWVDVLNMISLRNKKYKSIAYTSVAQALSGGGAKVGLGVSGSGVAGLFIGHLVENIIGLTYLCNLHKRQIRRACMLFTFEKTYKVAKEYISFPLWRVPSHILMAMSVQAPIYVVMALFGPEELGQYALVAAVIAAPVTVIAQSIGKVLYAEVAYIINNSDKSIAKICFKTQVYLLICAVPPAIIIHKYGLEIFTIILGEKWVPAGNYAETIVWMILFQFTSSPLVQLLNMFKKQVSFFIINAVRLMLLLGLYMYVKEANLVVHEFITWYTVIMSAFYVLVSLWILYVVYNDGQGINK